MTYCDRRVELIVKWYNLPRDTQYQLCFFALVSDVIYLQHSIISSSLTQPIRLLLQKDPVGQTSEPSEELLMIWQRMTRGKSLLRACPSMPLGVLLTGKGS